MEIIAMTTRSSINVNPRKGAAPRGSMPARLEHPMSAFADLVKELFLFMLLQNMVGNNSNTHTAKIGMLFSQIKPLSMLPFVFCGAF